ncbi:MAG: hypothetical protein F4Y74_13380 [Gemmatimonadales bacterium]|nr:hypothetical protein [Gemmatimonadales bacterium]
MRRIALSLLPLLVGDPVAGQTMHVGVRPGGFRVRRMAGETGKVRRTSMRLGTSRSTCATVADVRVSYWVVLAAIVLGVGCGEAGAHAPLRPAERAAASILVMPDSVTFTSLGEAAQLTTQVLDRDGQVIVGATLRWASHAPSVATVDSTGLVKATGNGTTTVTVTSGEASGRAEVIVYDRRAAVSADRTVLLSFYHATGGSRWRSNENWDSTRPLSEWAGVGTDEEGRVVALELPLNRLGGRIPPEIGKLDRLKTLHLHRNRVTGPIPSELGDLENLESLRLDHTGIEGTVPPELGQLTKLRTLNLFAASLGGTLPSELGNLTSLTTLVLGDDGIEGPLPAWLWDLAGLEVVHIISNRMTGPLPPEIGQLVNLRELVIYDIPLRGTIPSSIGKLADLEVLSLVETDLTGSIPPEIGDLPNLTVLSLAANRLISEIPREVGRLRALINLELYGNRLTGEIPAELGDLTNLQRIFLSHNSVTGPIPPRLGNLRRLQQLSLGGNNLAGPVPPELGNLGELIVLGLGWNSELTGPLPAGITRLSSLKWLYLHHTDLCVPEDSVFDAWLAQLDTFTGSRCSP